MRKTDFKISKNYPVWVLAVFLAGFLFLVGTPQRQARAETAPQPYDTLQASVEETLKAEAQKIQKLKDQLVQAEQAKKSALEKINALKIQLPIFNNLLNQSEIPVSELEAARQKIQAATQQIHEQMAAFSTRQNDIAGQIQQNQEQLTFTEQQTLEIIPKTTPAEAAVSATGPDTVTDTPNKTDTPNEGDKTDPADKTNNETEVDISRIYDQYQVLLKQYQEKQTLLSSIRLIYQETTAALQETKPFFDDLLLKFDEYINIRKKQELLERKTSLVSIGMGQISRDIALFVTESAAVFTLSFWAKKLDFVWTSNGIYAVSFALLFLIVQVLLFRVRRHLTRIMDHPELAERFWSLLGLRIIRKSIFLLGSTIFIYIYARAGQFQALPSIVSAGLKMLSLILFSELCIIALRLYCGEAATRLPQKPAFYFRVLIFLIRWAGMGYIFIVWVAASNATVQTIWRLMFELSFYGWNLFFWSALQKQQEKAREDPIQEWSSKKAMVVNGIKLLSFSIGLLALGLELSGYGLLALYWLASWSRTLVVVLGSLLLLKILLEWHPKRATPAETPSDAGIVPQRSLQWVMVQFLMLVWGAAGIILLVLAWGGKQTVLFKIYTFLGHTYQVGTMQFSLMGLIVAVLILLVTQAVVRIWRHVFRENILNQSGMEEGLQDSITTISVYVLWSIGILIALTAFGFNATSLTVVLGALGIGLGFGLQNIFNNFISGIILLFERPIQVGDDIEVNGLWGQVRKINVRSTVVQTYDNASLIIPNADLISTQVTNWSFKDKRLRRNVTVGVAYGSDVELVRKTLLEVVENTPRILKLPKPDVVFKDFGDSALIFVVRFWTRVEYFYTVETDVRFEINRLFRERKIEISFPQQDIHIRSGFDQKKPVILEKGKPVLTEESEDHSGKNR